MKKTISVVALDPRAGSFYADEIQALFGKYVSVRMYSVRDRFRHGAFGTGGPVCGVHGRL